MEKLTLQTELLEIQTRYIQDCLLEKLNLQLIKHPYDPQFRDKALSEMPLCNALSSEMLPKGFKYVSSFSGGVELMPGYYDLDDLTQEIVRFDYTIPHCFGINRYSNSIFCITTGQFPIKVFQNCNAPGERLNIIKNILSESKASDIYISPDNQVAILIGDRDEIESKLGLRYRLY